jgi:succinate dehydrogenase / fumarate reductase flavoprotein subunit
MYHQFKELADVDITKEPMEVGPTCHYVMGGVEVDRDTQMSQRARAVRGGRGARAACTARTGWAATRCPTCCVFGKRAGARRGEYAASLRPAVPWPTTTQRLATRRSRRSARAGAENPYRCTPTCRDDAQPGRHHPPRGRDARALERLEELATPGRRVASTGTGEYNPGWHLALDLRNMLLRRRGDRPAALERKESRGGHTRDDYPAMDREWRQGSTWLARRRTARSS